YEITINYSPGTNDAEVDSPYLRDKSKDMDFMINGSKQKFTYVYGGEGGPIVTGTLRDFEQTYTSYFHVVSNYLVSLHGTSEIGVNNDKTYSCPLSPADFNIAKQILESVRIK